MGLRSLVLLFSVSCAGAPAPAPVAHDAPVAVEAPPPEAPVLIEPEERSESPAVSPDVIESAGICARGSFGEAEACLLLLDEPSARDYAAQRCREDARYCFVSEVIERGSVARALEVFVVVTEVRGSERTTRTQRTFRRTGSASPPLEGSAERLSAACVAGNGPACAWLAVERDDTAFYARACDAGVLGACAETLSRSPSVSPAFTAALARVRAACDGGDRGACAHAAYGDAMVDAPGNFDRARATLDGACGLDAELSRTGSPDDRTTVRDEGIRPLTEWSDGDARARACSSLVVLSAAVRARVDRRSAARSVLRAACCDSDYTGPVPACRSFALSLQRGIGGARDRRLSAEMYELADASEELRF